MVAKTTKKRTRKASTKASPFATILFTLAALVFIAGSAVNLRYILTGDENIFFILDVKKEVERLKASNELLAKENQELRVFIDGLRKDSQVIEEEIRLKLNYVKEGEILYIEDQLDKK